MTVEVLPQAEAGVAVAVLVVVVAVADSDCAGMAAGSAAVKIGTEAM